MRSTLTIFHERLAARRQSRRGFTLMEILVVLALMVLIASLAAPSMLGMLETHKLRKSADLLRAEMADARLRAMELGQIQMFRYQIDGNQFGFEPWYTDEALLEGNQVGPSLLPPTAERDGLPDNRLEQLPDGIQILGGERSSDTRSMEIDLALSRELAANQTWSPPILFYPDGTSSDARIVLTNKRQQVVEVTLRGITGTTKAGDVMRLEEVLP